MSPHFAITFSEIFAIAGMIVFFLCFLPRMAFASGTGTRLVPTPVSGYHMLSPAVSRAIAQDKRNSRNPLYKLMDLIVRATGKRRYSYPAALFLISLLVRLALLPWTIRQFRDGQTMKALEPEIRRIQEECKADPKRMAAAIGALYKKHGINPRFAIFFAIVQGAIFLCLYNMVALYQYQFAHGAFFWIGGALAHSHPRWIAASLANPDLPLLALYGLSMVFTAGIAGAAGSENSWLLKANNFAPAIFISGLIWVRHTASAFVLYWLISNCLTLLIQAGMARRWKRQSGTQPPNAMA